MLSALELLRRRLPVDLEEEDDVEEEVEVEEEEEEEEDGGCTVDIWTDKPNRSFLPTIDIIPENTPSTQHLSLVVNNRYKN